VARAAPVGHLSLVHESPRVKHKPVELGRKVAAQHDKRRAWETTARLFRCELQNYNHDNAREYERGYQGGDAATSSL
jgi:hypothetical protein